MFRPLWLIVLAACSSHVAEPGDTPTPGPPQPLPDDVPEPGEPVLESVSAGALAPLPAFDDLPVHGSARMVRRTDGTSAVGLLAAGLDPSTAYSAHLHVWPCAFEAGGHYLLDPGAPDAGEANEVWPGFTTGADGVGQAWVEIPERLRGDALSVVVHDPVGGGKLACADLWTAQPIGARSDGTFAPFADAEPGDETVGGQAELVVGSSTTLDLSLSGLDPAATWDAHLHALPCDTLDGGAHYGIDPTLPSGTEDNELWPEIVVGPGGDAIASARAAGHAAREDAQSVVIHRVAGLAKPKVACADLVRRGYLPLEQHGTLVPLEPDGTAGGEVALEQRLDGVSVLTVSLTGLSAGAEHPVHLHDRPCDVDQGGGHYLLDPAAGEEGELWAPVVADTAGHAVRSVGVAHVLRADARSVVVHAADGARLACADLVD